MKTFSGLCREGEDQLSHFEEDSIASMPGICGQETSNVTPLSRGGKIFGTSYSH